MKQLIKPIVFTVILGLGALYLVSCAQVSQGTVYAVITK